MNLFFNTNKPWSTVPFEGFERGPGASWKGKSCHEEERIRRGASAAVGGRQRIQVLLSQIQVDGMYSSARIVCCEEKQCMYSSLLFWALSVRAVQVFLTLWTISPFCAWTLCGAISVSKTTICPTQVWFYNKILTTWLQRVGGRSDRTKIYVIWCEKAMVKKKWWPSQDFTTSLLVMNLSCRTKAQSVWWLFQKKLRTQPWEAGTYQGEQTCIVSFVFFLFQN